jgi:tetratricopeptide (TPR) repeat protein
MEKPGNKNSIKIKQHHLSENPKLFQSDWIFGFIILVFFLTAYQPAWNGKPLWDDDKHITQTDLRSVSGLIHIWTQLGATQQYYPLVHSVFWLEYHLWGDSPLGYHLFNILLHFFSALLLVCILRFLMIPGAWFVAAIFALHPVHVESVAWISELKNTMSGVFFLSAALAYLHFNRDKKGILYVIALGLFILGLMSKSVIATLPASLLVVFWWQRGRVDWKNEVLPLVPFFVIGIAYGIFTAWVERKFIGAEGSDFTFTIIERCLIAGRAVWFYLSKIAWPMNLIFIYPRWNVNQAIWWQYLFPLATLLLSVFLWILRKHWRAPLAAMLYFAITLFPALGFFNVYPFRYSFVADHFQYLAFIGPVVLFVGMGSAISVLKGRARVFICIMVLLILGFLTWRQSRLYADIEGFYRTIISKNPNCYMAYNNLGVLRIKEGSIGEAISLFRKSLEIKINSESHYNLGKALSQNGRTDEAIDHYQKALEINPNHSQAHNNLGNIFLQIGRRGEAILQFRKALEINPNYSEAHNNLGNALIQTGQKGEAISHFQKALEINPNYAEPHNNLGNVLFQTGQRSEAITHFHRALEINPNYAEAYNNLGNALFQTGHVEEAIANFSKALEINPDKISTLKNLAIAYVRIGKINDAIPLVEKALALAKYNGDEALAREIKVNLEQLIEMSCSVQRAPK